MLERNEWVESEVTDQSPYAPQPSGDNSNQSTNLADIVELENFDWFDEKVHGNDTYFTYVNKSRKPIKAGKQIFFCYDF